MRGVSKQAVDDMRDAGIFGRGDGRWVSALAYATGKHAGHRRKDTGIPYLSHLLQVAGLVLENGGDEEEAIAALLHDVVEYRAHGEKLWRRFNPDADQLWYYRSQGPFAGELERVVTELERVTIAGALHRLVDLGRQGTYDLIHGKSFMRNSSMYSPAATGADDRIPTDPHHGRRPLEHAWLAHQRLQAEG